MPSIELGKDLSQDPVESKNGDGSILTSESHLDVSLEKLVLRHRKWLFVVVLIVCCLLYLALFCVLFCLLFYKGSHFVYLVERTPYVIAFAISLLLVPSALLWGLIRAVFLNKNDDYGKKEEVGTVDLVSLLKALSKVHPTS